MQVKDLTKLGNKFVGNTSEQLTIEGARKCRAKLIPVDSLLMVFDAGITSVKNLYINAFKLCLNNKFGKIEAKQGDSLAYSYFLIRQVANNNFHSINRSTNAGGFGKEQFKSFEAKIPRNLKLISQFNQVCNPIFELQKRNEQMIQKFLRLQKCWVESL